MFNYSPRFIISAFLVSLGQIHPYEENPYSRFFNFAFLYAGSSNGSQCARLQLE
mgnify:FL=1